MAVRWLLGGGASVAAHGRLRDQGPLQLAGAAAAGGGRLAELEVLSMVVDAALLEGDGAWVPRNWKSWLRVLSALLSRQSQPADETVVLKLLAKLLTGLPANALFPRVQWEAVGMLPRARSLFL
jgi:hypothetical protein